MDVNEKSLTFHFVKNRYKSERIILQSLLKLSFSHEISFHTAGDLEHGYSSEIARGVWSKIVFDHL